jgi:hypothetical protein
LFFKGDFVKETPSFYQKPPFCFTKPLFFTIIYENAYLAAKWNFFSFTVGEASYFFKK